MPVNVWSAGRDELLEDLARRDVIAEREQAQARQAELDQQNENYRQANLSRLDRQLDSVDQDRDERRTAAAEAARAAAEAKANEQKLIDAAMKTIADPNAPPAEREQAGMFLDMKNVDPKRLDRIQGVKPPVENQEVWQTDPRTGKLTKMGTVPKGSHFVATPRPPTGDADSSKVKDDPKLPNGTKAWIETISARGIPLADARAELSKGWSQQRAAHPRAELAAAAKYLNDLYPETTDPIMGTKVQTPLGVTQETEAPPPPPPGRAQGAGPAAGPRTVQTPAPKVQGPPVGTPGVVNGVPAVWDGQGWLPAS